MSWEVEKDSLSGLFLYNQAFKLKTMIKSDVAAYTK